MKRKSPAPEVRSAESPIHDWRFWSACFDALPVQACVVDADGKIMIVNSAWQHAAQEKHQYVDGLTPGVYLLAQIAKRLGHAEFVARRVKGQHDSSSLNHGVLRQFTQAFSSIRDEQHALVTIEFSDYSKGTVRWYRARLSKLHKELPPLHFLLCLDDITSRKLEQEAMQTAALVYEHSDQAIMVTDANNLIIAINPGFTQLTGYEADEVIGKNPNFASSGRHDADFYRLMWHSLNTNHSWQGEIWNKKKNGEEIAEWITMNAIIDSDGKPSRYVAIFSDITQQNRQREKHWQQANFDALTGLPNRRLMLDRLETELRKAHRSHRMVALLFIDLDHFKEVNDRLGHAMGDVLLKETAKRLTDCVRETDTVARMGGDEFIITMGDFASTQHVDQVAQSVLDSLSRPFDLGEQQGRVTGSIGIAIYPGDAQNSQHLIECADQAMYDAKRGGKNRYCYYLPSKSATDTSRTGSSTRGENHTKDLSA